MALRLLAGRRALVSHKTHHSQGILSLLISRNGFSACYSRNAPEMQRIATSCFSPRLLSTTTSSLDEMDDSGASTNTTTVQEPLHESQESTRIVVDPGFAPERVIQDVARAAQWNQGGEHDAQWDYEFCRTAVDDYERHMVHILRRLEEHGSEVPLEEIVPLQLVEQTQQLLSAVTAEKAVKAVLKCKLHTTELSQRVRELERLIGNIGRTPLTEKLSLRLVEANGKAGNIGRVLSLLNLRSSRNYKPLEREFVYAVQAIQSAGLYMREGRNILLGDSHQPDIDNPTRWLDAILIHMHTRQVPLTTKMANRMLDCYASTGRTSKALHFFHYVSRQAIVDPETLEFIPLTDEEYREMPKFRQRRVRVKMRFRPPPNYYKVPSESKDKLVAMPGETTRKTKLEFENDQKWSLPLTAAFSFADSLTHGACGHEPIELDITSYNILVKICCYRGALWRAMQILETTMPQQGFEPNTLTYNTLLAGLARVVSIKWRFNVILIDELAFAMTDASVSILAILLLTHAGRHCDAKGALCRNEQQERAHFQVHD